MVNFHAFRTGKLASELSQEAPTPRVQFYYMLGSQLLISFLLYYSLFWGAFVDWLFLLEALVVLLITFIGVYEAYRANGADDGDSFILRATCLFVPITINTAIASQILSWLYMHAAPIIADPSVFSYPSRPLQLIEFVWVPIFTGVMFWRLHVHIRRVSASSLPHKGFNTDADKARAG